MGIVEDLSFDWMRIIEKVLIKGKMIRCNANDTGPIDELEHWLQTNSMYSIAQELISTQHFQHHIKCLQLSRSKLEHVNHTRTFLFYFAFQILKFVYLFILRNGNRLNIN